MASTSEISTTTSAGPIIKSDRIGRTRYTKAYKAEVVAAFEQSGMSAAAFAKHCGVKYPTLAAWVARARQLDPDSGGDAGPQFLLAELGASSEEATLKLELPSGVMVHVSSPRQFGLLTQLLRTLN